MKFSKITISGRACTGKTTLFWQLQEHLNWPTFSTSQFFRDYARTKKLELDLAQEQEKKLTIKTDLRIKKLLEKDINIIVEGWMAGIMADELAGVLRIFLTASYETRIKRYAEREKVSLTEAEKRLKSREDSWLKKLADIYPGINIFDPRHYNFVIDTASLTPSQTLRRVLDKLGTNIV